MQGAALWWPGSSLSSCSAICCPGRHVGGGSVTLVVMSAGVDARGRVLVAWRMLTFILGGRLRWPVCHVGRGRCKGLHYGGLAHLCHHVRRCATLVVMSAGGRCKGPHYGGLAHLCHHVRRFATLVVMSAGGRCRGPQYGGLAHLCHHVRRFATPVVMSAGVDARGRIMVPWRVFVILSGSRLRLSSCLWGDSDCLQVEGLTMRLLS